MKSAAGEGFSRPRLLVKTSEPPRRFTRWPGRSSCPVDLDTANRRTASPASNPTKRSRPAASCCASRTTRRAIAGGSARSPAAVDLYTARRLQDKARRYHLRGIVQVICVFTRNSGRAIEDIDDSRREASVEQGEQLMADPITRNRDIGIRRVFAKRDAAACKNCRTSEREVSMKGRTTMPARGWMPLKPRGPAPRSSRRRNVSA